MITKKQNNLDEKNFYPGDIIPVEFKEEMEDAYLTYAISVLVARALPDIRDGLKPVHRRILYTMWVNHNRHTDRFRKSSQIVGRVLGDFHPHGDVTIYDTLARLAQVSSMSVPLIQGHGNMGDAEHEPAAMRYTEARLASVAQYLLEDLKYDVVEMQPSYDNSNEEPTILPVKFPLLLVNGSSGIAVGMATNIPPHNLKEVAEATKHFILNPECPVEELMSFIQAPDFPTGGEILYSRGIRNLYETGKGSITIRAKAKMSDRSITFYQLPYQTSKSIIVMQIATLIEKQELLGVSDVVDESDKYGIRVVVYLKKDAYQDLILKKLYANTNLQQVFHGSMVALSNAIPQTVNLKNILGKFVEFRNLTLISKFTNQLREAREKIHTLIGSVVAKDNLGQVLETIHNAGSRSHAVQLLCNTRWNSPSIAECLNQEFDANVDVHQYVLSERQAEAILDMRLQQLTKLETEELLRRISDMKEKISYYGTAITSDLERQKIILEELDRVQEFSHGRRSEIIRNFSEITDQDLIPNESFIVLIDPSNHIKKMPVTDYKRQHRGGLGKSGIDSTTACSIISNALDTILLFSNMGRVYSMRCYEVPTMNSGAKGRALINFIPIQPKEYITNAIRMDNSENSHVVFVTARGMVKKNSISSFAKVRANGKTAIKLMENDHIVKILAISSGQKLVLASRKGRAVRFDATQLREMQSRNTIGVIGMRLATKDCIVDACCVDDNTYLISVSRCGLCKITPVEEYRSTNKGAKGVSCMRLTGDDSVVSIFSLDKLEGEIFTVTNNGQIVRSSVDEVRQSGRNTKGVKLVRFREEGDFVLKSMAFNDVSEQTQHIKET